MPTEPLTSCGELAEEGQASCVDLLPPPHNQAVEEPAPSFDHQREGQGQEDWPPPATIPFFVKWKMLGAKRFDFQVSSHWATLQEVASELQQSDWHSNRICNAEFVDVSIIEQLFALSCGISWKDLDRNLRMNEWSSGISAWLPFTVLGKSDISSDKLHLELQ